MRKYPRGHKWWVPSPEEAELRRKIAEYREAISFTKAFINSTYHSEYETSRKAIKRYDRQIVKLLNELQSLIDAESQ